MMVTPVNFVFKTLKRVAPKNFDICICFNRALSSTILRILKLKIAVTT